MRLISLGVMFDANVDPKDVMNSVERNFPNHLPDYRLFQPETSNYILILWNKIVVGETNNTMNTITQNIIDDIPESEVFLDELGDAPTFWKRHKDAVVGISFGLGSIVTTIIIHIINKIPPS